VSATDAPTPSADAGGDRPVVAVAGGPVLLDPAPALVEALDALGADVRTVDLAADDALPEGTVAFVLGDGAPVPFVDALSENASLRAAVKALHRSGAPVVAEGAGAAFLAASLDGRPMCDLLPAVATAGRGGVPGTVELTAASDGPLHVLGDRKIGRPSAAVALDGVAGARPAWMIGRRHEGWSAPDLHASLVVVGWNRDRAARLLRAAGVAR
jgi:cobyrinic acid a,c-diamide synthase